MQLEERVDKLEDDLGALREALPWLCTRCNKKKGFGTVLKETRHDAVPPWFGDDPCYGSHKWELDLVRKSDPV